MLDGYRFIAIEGPIGVGKTSLARALARRAGARLVLEPAEANPFLERFYSDMARYALPTQLAFLVARHGQQAELRQRDPCKPLVVADYILAKDGIFAMLTLQGDELRLYSKLYDALARHAARPDVVVLLQADVETLVERVRRRGIGYESGVSRDYLARVVAAYEVFFRCYADSPVLRVDARSADYSRRGPALDRLIEDLERMRGGTRPARRGRKDVRR